MTSFEVPLASCARGFQPQVGGAMCCYAPAVMENWNPVSFNLKNPESVYRADAVYERDSRGGHRCVVKTYTHEAEERNKIKFFI